MARKRRDSLRPQMGRQRLGRSEEANFPYSTLDRDGKINSRRYKRHATRKDLVEDHIASGVYDPVRNCSLRLNDRCVQIFTDGSAIENPGGKGGIAVVVHYPGHLHFQDEVICEIGY